MDGTKPPKKTESDEFDYLLKEIVEAEEKDSAAELEEPGTSLPSDALSSFPVGDDDATASEVLLGLDVLSSTEAGQGEAEGTETEGFQFDPLPRSWAKRSERKLPSRFPRYSKQPLQTDLDVEQLLEGGASELSAAQEVALAQDIAEIKSGLDELAESTIEDGIGAVAPMQLLIDEVGQSKWIEAFSGERRSGIAANASSATDEGLDEQRSVPLVSHVDDVPDLSMDPFFDTTQKQDHS
jgi:hypothetical protein